jgi:Na+-translocating ferredoxin:NAD+ oxidoreductase RNF subunit RnfB
MNLTAILYAALVLGGLGVVFGAVLSFADKKFAVEVDERVALVREALPGANCGACGFAGCDAFSQAVVDGKAKPNGCIPGGANCASAIAGVMGVKAEAWIPVQATVCCQGAADVAKSRYEYTGFPSCRQASGMAGGPKRCRYACLGLGDCVSVCAFGALSIENGLAKVDEGKCTACGMCAAACPRGVIHVMPARAKVIVRCQNHDAPKAAREACQKACIACRRCEKECKAGAIVLEDNCARIDETKCTRCGDCVKVCPTGCIV